MDMVDSVGVPMDMVRQSLKKSWRAYHNPLQSLDLAVDPGSSWCIMNVKAATKRRRKASR